MAYRLKHKDFPFTGKQTDDIPEGLLSLPLLKRVNNLLYEKTGALSTERSYSHVSILTNPVRLGRYKNQLLGVSKDSIQKLDERNLAFKVLKNRKNIQLDIFPVARKETDLLFPAFTILGDLGYLFYWDGLKKQIIKTEINLENDDIISQGPVTSVQGILPAEVNDVRGMQAFTYENKVRLAWLYYGGTKTIGANVANSGGNIKIVNLNFVQSEWDSVRGALSADIQELTGVGTADQFHFCRKVNLNIDPNNNDNDPIERFRVIDTTVYYVTTSMPVVANAWDGTSNIIKTVSEAGLFNPADEAVGLNGKTLYDFRKWLEFTEGTNDYLVIWSPKTGYFITNISADIVSHFGANDTPLEYENVGDTDIPKMSYLGDSFVYWKKDIYGQYAMDITQTDKNVQDASNKVFDPYFQFTDRLIYSENRFTKKIIFPIELAGQVETEVYDEPIADGAENLLLPSQYVGVGRPLGIALASLCMDCGKPEMKKIGDQMLISGPALNYYNGKNIIEQSFTEKPIIKLESVPNNLKWRYDTSQIINKQNISGNIDDSTVPSRLVSEEYVAEFEISIYMIKEITMVKGVDGDRTGKIGSTGSFSVNGDTKFLLTKNVKYAVGLSDVYYDESEGRLVFTYDETTSLEGFIPCQAFEIENVVYPIHRTEKIGNIRYLYHYTDLNIFSGNGPFRIYALKAKVWENKNQLTLGLFDNTLTAPDGEKQDIKLRYARYKIFSKVSAFISPPEKILKRITIKPDNIKVVSNPGSGWFHRQTIGFDFDEVYSSEQLELLTGEGRDNTTTTTDNGRVILGSNLLISDNIKFAFWIVFSSSSFTAPLKPSSPRLVFYGDRSSFNDDDTEFETNLRRLLGDSSFGTTVNRLTRIVISSEGAPSLTLNVPIISGLINADVLNSSIFSVEVPFFNDKRIVSHLFATYPEILTGHDAFVTPRPEISFLFLAEEDPSASENEEDVAYYFDTIYENVASQPETDIDSIDENIHNVFFLVSDPKVRISRAVYTGYVSQSGIREIDTNIYHKHAFLSFGSPFNSFHFPDGDTDIKLIYYLEAFATNTLENLLKASVYKYICRFKWIDENGIEHRSLWSDPITVALGLADENSTTRAVIGNGNIIQQEDGILRDGTITTPVDLRVNFLHFSDRRNVKIELYRTMDLQNVYQKVDLQQQEAGTNSDNPRAINAKSTKNILIENGDLLNGILLTDEDGNKVFNDESENPNTSSVVVEDTRKDNELGQVIQPDRVVVNGCKFVLEFQDRFVCYGFPKRKNYLVISSPLDATKNFAVSFSDTGIPQTSFHEVVLNDDIIKCEVLDQQLIIFTREDTYYWKIGMPKPIKITGASGIKIKDSENPPLFVNPSGIIFISNKNVPVSILKGMSVKTHDEVSELLNRDDMVEVVNVENRYETRFLLRSGRVLIYNYRFDNWSVLESKNIVSHTVWKDRYVYVTKAGDVFQEEEYLQRSLENEKVKECSFETGWIHLHKLDDYLKIRDFILYGKFYGLEYLACEVSFDGFKFPRLMVYDLNRAQRPAGSESGDRNLDDSTPFRFQPYRQKCSSIKLKFILRCKTAEIFNIKMNYMALAEEPKIVSGGA